MLGHREAHDGEPHAAAGELLRTMQALERREQPMALREVEARAVVAHAVFELLREGRRLDLDLGGRRGFAELEGIAHELGPYLPKKVGIARNSRQCGYAHARVRVLDEEARDNLARDR